jgi:hypothetical protein
MSLQDPSVLFNAMIVPLLKHAIKGAIWYQVSLHLPRVA